MIDFPLFCEVFLLNVERRSRTAKGLDKGSETSAKKKKLGLSGDELKAKVKENTERLAAAVYQAAMACLKNPYEFLPARSMQPLCENWFDIANEGIIDWSVYEADRAALGADAARAAPLFGADLKVNPRFRLWTPDYTIVKVPPLLLDKHMWEFYRRLEKLLLDPEENNDLETAKPAPIMAFADCMMDGELHPWIDGCSRVSTALVMFLAAILPGIGDSPPL
ncbi:MAG: hypothetical protein AAB692_04605, partial [Patescibacteria group bacterium]